MADGPFRVDGWMKSYNTEGMKMAKSLFCELKRKVSEMGEKERAEGFCKEVFNLDDACLNMWWIQYYY